MSNSAAATATATAAEGGEGASIYSLDHHHGSPLLPPSEHLCHLHCTLCHTLLAVSVPCTSLYNTVTVTCGHCSTLLPVNLPALFLHQSLAAATTGPPSQPPPATGHNSFSPSSSRPLTGEAQNTCPRFQAIRTSNSSTFSPSGHGRINQFPKPSATNRPPEKRRRVPSAYNRFIKDEIQRIKAGNPNISHREAFSAAAKNWAHFPHIHFGLMPDHMLRKTSYHSSPGS